MTTDLDDLPLFAPRAPSVRGSVTSAAAAESLAPETLSRLHAAVLEYLRARPDGATDEEMQREIPMPPSTQRPRRVWLVQRGYVVEDGQRKVASGRNASVWRAVK